MAVLLLWLCNQPRAAISRLLIFGIMRNMSKYILTNQIIENEAKYIPNY